LPTKINGFWTVDVSDPADLVEVGFYDTPGNAMGVTVVGSHVYVADGNEGLRIIDVSNPAFPFEVGFFNTGGIAGDVAVLGIYAYVAEGDQGLRIIDISNKSAPFEAGFIDPGSVTKVVVVDDYAYRLMVATLFISSIYQIQQHLLKLAGGLNQAMLMMWWSKATKPT
jgi:hypothetical protein